MENQPIKAEYTLHNIVYCMALCEDMRNPNNGVIVNSAYKWIRKTVERKGELTTEDRENFMSKFYHIGKNM